jgi:hypothetical protein
MSTPPTAPEPSDSADGRRDDPLRATLGAVAGAVATGIGVVGLTTVIGGALLYVAFERVGLPGHHAIAVIPKATLLVYGAQALLSWFFGAILTTLVAYVIHPSTDSTSDADKRRARRAAVAVLCLWFVGMVVFGAPFRSRALLLVGLALGFFLLVLFLIWHFDRWLPVGVAIFVMSVVIGAGVQALRTYYSPKVRPGAVLRKGEKTGISGIYIADTDAWVYLAKIAPREPGAKDAESRGVSYTSRLVAIPKADVEELAVGKLRRLRNALARAEVLREELLTIRAKTESAGGRAEGGATSPKEGDDDDD